MSEPKPQRKHIQIDKDLAQFYQALATLNVNLVLKVRENPEIVGEITDSILDFCALEEPCNAGYIWDEGQRACVKLLEPSGH